MTEELEQKKEQNSATPKVQITMKIDLDVLNFFKARASDPNSAPYQTQINTELRAIMEGSVKEKVKVKKAKVDAKKLLSNKKFIKAVTAEVKKQLVNSN
jgi:BrnA antitoxin of type II toxin-antitoxin system